MRRLYEPLIPLSQLSEQLREREVSFSDKVVDADAMSVDDRTGNLLVRNGTTHEHAWQTQALGLMASKLRVPLSYLNRCPPELRAENLNHWLRKRAGQEFLIRFDGDEVRAVLSPRYQPISNVQLAETVRREAGNVLVRAEIDDMHMLLQVVTSRGEEVSFGDRIHGGLHIANSEVGHRVVEIRAMLYRILCCNGLIMGTGQAGIRRRHLGDADKILRQFRATTRTAIEVGSSLPGRLGETRHVRVPDPIPVFDRIASRYKLDDAEQEAVHVAFETEPGDSLWSVIHALTRAGNNAALSVGSREKLQRTGGRILELAERGTRWID